MEQFNQNSLLSEEITSVTLERFLNTEQKILIEEKIEDEDLFVRHLWMRCPNSLTG